jgi:hypothetical protein
MELMTMGPDRPITLHLADAKFQEVFTKAIVGENMDRKLKVDMQAASTLEILFCDCALLDAESGEVIKQEKVNFSKKEAVHLDWDLDSAQVQLWWPNGHGEQKRYRFECQLKTEVSTPLAFSPELFID